MQAAYALLPDERVFATMTNDLLVACSEQRTHPSPPPLPSLTLTRRRA